jgi:hypothetical protein
MIKAVSLFFIFFGADYEPVQFYTNAGISALPAR